MIEVDIMNVKGPMLIAEAPTGVKYVNQVGGCSCQHAECEGFLIPLGKTNSRVFNPEFWYHGVLGIPNNHEEKVPHFTHLEEFDAYLAAQTLKMQERWNCVDITRNEIWQEAQEVVAALCIWPDIQDFRIDFDYKYNMEAWVRCSFALPKQQKIEGSETWETVHIPYSGWLTWENCD